MMARLAGLEPATYGLAYHFDFRRRKIHFYVRGLDHIFTISGGVRMASTDPFTDRTSTMSNSTTVFFQPIHDLSRGFLGVAIAIL